MRASGGRLVTVNATGCLEVFSSPYPESAWRVPWLHSLFGNAPAVAAGVAAALQVTGPRRRPGARPGRRRRHAGHRLRLPVGHVRARRRRALRLLRQPGLHEHRGAALRRHSAGGADHDDAGGRRASAATDIGTGKDAPRIAMAHGMPYVATATVADLRDLEARSPGRWPSAGRATCTCWCPCPLGWGTPSEETVRAGPAGHADRALPAARGGDGEVVATTPIRRREPVEDLPAAADALRAPLRPRSAATEVIDRIQRRPTGPWPATGWTGAAEEEAGTSVEQEVLPDFAVTPAARRPAWPTTPVPGVPSARVPTCGRRAGGLPGRRGRPRLAAGTPRTATTRPPGGS